MPRFSGLARAGVLVSGSAFGIFCAAACGLTISSAIALDTLPKTTPVPADNPQTPAKVELGKKLFFDTRLSMNNQVSCNSCHNVLGGGVDNLQFSVGVGGHKGGRNAPTVWNSAFNSVQFWDGRAPSLEEQAKGPMVNPVEMAMTNHELVTQRIASVPEYAKEFKAIFGGANPVTIDNVAKAIAAYERTLVTPNSPYDRFAKGDKKALNASAQRGLKLVQSVGCTSCHSGPNFAGPALPTGTGFYQKFPLLPGTEYDKKYGFSKDQGRFEVTKSESDRNLWRVPTWRNIALTGPYFHNGAVDSLDEAVRVMAKTQLNKTLADGEVKDIVEFLKGLTGVRPRQTAPKLPAGGPVAPGAVHASSGA